MTTFKPKTIDEYIASFPVETRAVLEEVREAILQAIPGAEEAISYDMPTFSLGGSYVIYFAGWKKHIALYPITQIMAEKLKDELAGYKGTKNSVHFPLNKPMPVDLIAKIVEVKLLELPRKSKAKNKNM
jgi:uncharacterized protein YdhG (YjbR/CyaY superfamily)